MDESGEDNISPEVLQEYADNTFSKTYNNSKNPFKLPIQCEIFGFKEFEKKRIQNERESIRRMSLIQRADLQKPKIPTCILSSSLISKTASRKVQPLSSLSTSTILRQKREEDQQKSIRVTEFIHQKREIYIIQLLIDKKKEEIKQIYDNIETSEKNLIQRNEKIESDSEKIKLANTHTEMRLARAKRHLEDEITKKVDLQRKLRNVTNNVFTMNSEISKNEDQLQSFRSYEDFLKMMTPDGEEIFDYFNNPEVLLRELSIIEQDNLNLIQSCQYFDSVLEKGATVIKKKDDETISHIDNIKGQIDRLPIIEELPEDISLLYTQAFDEKDQEVHYWADLVEKIYINCFGATADVTPIVMLQRINNKLEDFYRLIELVDPDFVQSRQAIKDKQRRETQRKEKQEKQEAEIKIKMEQALARANRPIKKKNGRPVYGRTYLRKNEKKADLKLLRELKEKKATEKLLYGDPFENI